jgi:hypothetical protein
VSYGYYDYIVDARPSQYGTLSLVASQQSSQKSPSSQVVVPPLYGYQLRAAPYKQTPAAMQFSRSNTIPENIFIPSLNPTNQAPGTNNGGGSVPSPNMALASAGYPTSAEEALAKGLTSYFVAYPPMPPIITNVGGVLYAIPWEDVYGPEPSIEIQISPTEQATSLQPSTRLGPLNGPQPMGNWSDQTYETRTPIRSPGNLFFGFAGSVGIGFQGHHPKKPPVFGNAAGGVLAATPPWGPLKTASSLANNFSINMGYAGWRTSFLLGDDNLNSLDLNPIMGTGTGTGRFATMCNLGFLVGHMTASANNDPNFSATVPYVPIYNSTQPGSYQWIATPDMDLGNNAGSVYSKLKWMAFYGCQSFKERDYSALWTKFLLPMPPNLRLILGAEDGVFIMPSFGSRFAADLNGWTVPGGSPMSIWGAWCDAAADTDNRMSHTGWYKIGYPMGTRRVTAIYRDISQGGSWKTINDSIWGWWSDISYDWFDVSFDITQVY